MATLKEALKKTKEEKRLSIVMPLKIGRKFDECLENNGDMQLVDDGRVIIKGKFKEISDFLTNQGGNNEKK